jgi:hypothetical protein
MAKYEAKTKPGRRSVEGWVARIRDPERRKDCRTLLRLMKKATKAKPRMWATMVGFGDYHYKYASGHEGDCFQMGFASRKPDLVLYLVNGPDRQARLLSRLGKHKLGKSCLYIRRLSDVDPAVLGKLITSSAQEMRKNKGQAPCS